MKFCRLMVSFGVLMIKLNLGLSEKCYLSPVIHILKYRGCIPKHIPSFACSGTCSSYVQASVSKFWQVEHSCMCCQEMSEMISNTFLFCPSSNPRIRVISTKAPLGCTCRPCSAVGESTVVSQELVG